MESGETFISGFLTSGIEPMPRGSYTSTNHSAKLSSSFRESKPSREVRTQKLDDSLAEWLVLVYEPRGLGSIPKVTNPEIKYFSGFHH